MAAPAGLEPGAPDLPASVAGGWEPLCVLGAASTMSIALPAAAPTRSQLYAPRGVLLDAVGPANGSGTEARTRVIAADTGNHRLLVWDDVPTADGADSAVVVGQPNATSEGPQAGGRGPERGLHLPTGLALADGLLLVADGWNHRIVGYDATLGTDDPEPVYLYGQNGFTDLDPNRGHDPDAASLYWPFGLLWHDGWLWVADTGNRRVLGWHGLPSGDRPADVVLGQPNPHVREENRGGDVGPASFRWPHAVAVLDGVLWVSDAGNHRVLGWELPVDGDRPADRVLGQAGFDTAAEMPHVPQGPARLRFPYSVAATRRDLVVADTANNRVLVWDLPMSGGPASAVLGQVGFDPGGENRWTAVTGDSLCWPYGISVARDRRHGDLLAIADSGNNRVVLWRRP